MFRETKVADSRLPRLINQNIARLDVTMNHAFLMCVCPGFGGGLYQLCRRAHRHRSGSRFLRQSFAIDKGHREIVQALMLTDFEHRHNRRMIQLCGRFGFDSQPLNLRAAGELAGPHHLQRDLAIEPYLTCSVNHSQKITAACCRTR